MSYDTAVVVTDLVMCYTDILATYVEECFVDYTCILVSLAF